MTLTAAFADPVADSQACFRGLLDAMARPGRIHAVADGLCPPAPLAPATAAVLLTLIDETASLWVDETLDGVWDWLAFHCGAQRAAPGMAAFAVATSVPDLAGFSAGSDAGPEESATIVLQLPALGTGTAYRLAGPGLRAPYTLRAAGLPADFVARWAANHALFPRGADLILCAGNQLCALPRTVNVEEA